MFSFINHSEKKQALERKDICEDDVSVTSSASSVQDAIVTDHDRRRRRLNKIRESRRKNYSSGKKGGKNDKIWTSFDSTNSTTSIMSVRTLNESLNGCTISEMKKLRRKVFVKFKKIGTQNDESSRTADEESVERSDISINSSSAVSSITCALADLKLGFRDVQIREYEVVPGCNPSISAGVPLELGWAHTKSRIVPLQQFEDLRKGRRRLQSQMRMPRELREELLLIHGSNPKQIRAATKDALQVKRQRLSTAVTLSVKGELHDEQMDKVKKILSRPFRNKKKKRMEEEALWANVPIGPIQVRQE